MSTLAPDRKVNAPAKTAAKKGAPKRALEPLLGAPARLGTHVVHLSDPEMKGALDEIKRRIRDEPGFKQQLMQSAGILNAKGKLTKLYGGR